MSTLTIHCGSQTYSVSFSQPQKLSVLLEKAEAPMMHPCGGRGVCGKCAVLLSGQVSAPNTAELQSGVRLSCQASVLGDAEVFLPVASPMEQIEAGSSATLSPLCPMPGRLGAAIDIGTTTLALRLYNLQSGVCLAVSTMLNPQTTIAGDVIGRMDAAIKGKLAFLQASIEKAIQTLLRTACAQAAVLPKDVESLVITGNTTMLYLLTGKDPSSLSHAPFEADCFFDETYFLLNRRCYLPLCLHAFVGADTVCALLTSGMLEKQETALLCDIGTNGEIALWHEGQLYISSTAAGPAFEGAGIRCGCGSIPGAIDHAAIENGKLRIHTIGNQKPIGLCGSGLLDVIASLLKLEIIDDTGAMEEHEYELAEGVVLTQQDVRALQLAKAAISAGIDSLLNAAACPENAVTTVYLAGGFGSHLNIENAVEIGLIPSGLADRVRVIGNAALDGAAMLLANTGLLEKESYMRQIANHIRLDGNSYFSQRYIDAMMFEV